MFSRKEIKDSNTSVKETLQAMSDDLLREEVEVQDKFGTTILHQFAKHRSSEEFTYLLSRLSSDCIEANLSKWITVSLEDGQRRKATLLNFVFQYQDKKGIMNLLRSINTSIIIDIIYKSISNPKIFLSWRTSLNGNKKLKGFFPEDSSEHSAFIRSILGFFEIIRSCKKLHSKNNKDKNIDFNLSKLSFELALYYRDDAGEFQNWCFYHFFIAALQFKRINKKAMEEGVSKIMRNLKPHILERLSARKCQDPKHKGSNILHFALYYVKNEDDILMLCEKASDETLNLLLSQRIGGSKYLLELNVRNLSAMQMILRHLSQPTIEKILDRATPETLYHSLIVDVKSTKTSDNTKTLFELAKSNEKLQWGENGFDALFKKIKGTCLFYELYDYFKVLEPKKGIDLLPRKAIVSELTAMLRKGLESEHLSEELLNFYYDKCDLDAFECIDEMLIRSFHELLFDICNTQLVGVDIAKEGYAACKDIFDGYFGCDEVIKRDNEKEDESVETPLKKVRYASNDEVFQYDK